MAVSDAMIEAGVSVIYGMDHNLGKTAEDRCDDDVLRNDLAELYLAMKAKEEAAAPRKCKRCRTPEGEPHRYRHIPEYVDAEAADQSPADEIERDKALIASCRAFALQMEPYGVARLLNDAADRIAALSAIRNGDEGMRS